MNKCVKVSIFTNLADKFLNSIQKHAQELKLEGFSQKADEDDFKIIINGTKEKVDKFLDYLHKELIKLNIEDFEIEPFVKDKDYRGVFRIIQ